MSEFKVEVVKVKISSHPNADAIEIAHIGDYQSIVRKGDFSNGNFVAYIPEGSVLPDELITQMGLVGRLAGAAKNRVKAIKLRGVLSQGLVYPARRGWAIGEDVATELGITKYVPTLPPHLRGRAKGMAYDITVNYDVENIKKWDRSLLDGECVYITEKIHGTNIQIGDAGVGSGHEAVLWNSRYWVTSKGLGGRGIVLDFDDESNVYVSYVTKIDPDIFTKLEAIRIELREWVRILGGPDYPIALVGELFGPGIQKGFTYGESLQFRLFDIAVGTRSTIQYLDADKVEELALKYDIPHVPILYIGPYSKEKVQELTDGNEMVSGKSLHIREGVVVKPCKERRDDEVGRIILKSVSEAYLLRGKGKDDEETEYQ